MFRCFGVSLFCGLVMPHWIWYNWGHNIIQARFLMPTGRRQTSWMFTSAAEKLNQNQMKRVARTGLELDYLRLSRQAPNDPNR